MTPALVHARICTYTQENTYKQICSQLLDSFRATITSGSLPDPVYRVNSFCGRVTKNAAMLLFYSPSLVSFSLQTHPNEINTNQSILPTYDIRVCSRPPVLNRHHTLLSLD